jgi:hypothetical protein
MDLAALTLATFEPLVGDAFAVDSAAAAEPPIEFVLASATSAGDWPGGRQPFSLIFHGPPEPLLPQAIYALAHAGLGALEIFVVPIARDAAGVSYQAIFT